jgi:hypothetical protein
MSRTPTLPPNDRGMWRRLVSRAHPDAGGDHDLFIWAVATRTVVCGGELGTDIPRRERQDHPSRRREASTSTVRTGQERASSPLWAISKVCPRHGASEPF